MVHWNSWVGREGRQRWRKETSVSLRMKMLARMTSKTEVITFHFYPRFSSETKDNRINFSLTPLHYLAPFIFLLEGPILFAESRSTNGCCIFSLSLFPSRYRGANGSVWNKKAKHFCGQRNNNGEGEQLGILKRWTFEGTSFQLTCRLPAFSSPVTSRDLSTIGKIRDFFSRSIVITMEIILNISPQRTVQISTKYNNCQQQFLQV